jgi:hypothetical protein
MIDFYGQSPFFSPADDFARSIQGALSDPTGAVSGLGPQMPNLPPKMQQAIAEQAMQAQAATPPPMQQPMAQQPMAPQQGPEWQQKLNQFMGSPGFAMAMAAGHNLANSRAGSVNPRVDPVQAYQQTIQRQALIKQSEREAKLREAQEERLRGQEARMIRTEEREMNPAWEYEALQESGLISPDMTFEEYETKFGRRAADDPSAVREWRYYSSLPEAEKAAYLQMKRASQLVPFGGGTQGVVGPGNVAAPLSGGPTAEGFGAREGVVAAGREAGTQAAQTDAEQVNAGLQGAWAANTGYGDAQVMLDESQRFLDMLDSGKVDTGVIPAALYNIFGIGTEELAAMDNEGIMQTLRNLGITNLAPVTEREFAAVAKLWATISKEEKPNKGSIKQAMRRTERLMSRMENDVLKEAQRVRQYGGEAAYADMLATNPLLQRVLAKQKQGAADEKPAKRRRSFTRDENGNLVEVQ